MIAIKDYTMPSCCVECMLTTCKGKDEPWNYCCSITLTDIDFDGTKRPSDCPLVETKAEEKLEKIEQIVKEYDGSTTSMIKQFSEIQRVLEQE